MQNPRERRVRYPSTRAEPAGACAALRPGPRLSWAAPAFKPSRPFRARPHREVRPAMRCLTVRQRFPRRAGNGLARPGKRVRRERGAPTIGGAAVRAAGRSAVACKVHGRASCQRLRRARLPSRVSGGAFRAPSLGGGVELGGGVPRRPRAASSGRARRPYPYIPALIFTFHVRISAWGVS